MIIQLLSTWRSLWPIGYGVHQAPLSMGFSRQEYWSGLPRPPPRGSSWPRDQTQVSHIVGRCFTVWAIREVSQLSRSKREESHIPDIADGMDITGEQRGLCGSWNQSIVNSAWEVGIRQNYFPERCGLIWTKTAPSLIPRRKAQVQREVFYLRKKISNHWIHLVLVHLEKLVGWQLLVAKKSCNMW